MPSYSVFKFSGSKKLYNLVKQQGSCGVGNSNTGTVTPNYFGDYVFVQSNPLYNLFICSDWYHPHFTSEESEAQMELSTLPIDTE